MFLKITKLNSSFLRLMATSAIALAIFPIIPATAARPTDESTGIQCQIPPQKQLNLSNSATVSYTNSTTNRETAVNSNTLATTVETIRPSVETIAAGIKDDSGQAIINLGLVASAVEKQLIEAGLTQGEAEKASIAALESFVGLPLTETTTGDGLVAVRGAIAATLTEPQQNLIASITDADLLVALSALTPANLMSLGLSETEAETAAEAVIEAVNSVTPDSTIEAAWQNIYDASIAAAGEQSKTLSNLQEELQSQKFLLRTGVETHLQAGDVLNFEFQIANTKNAQAVVTIPNLSSFESSSLSGPGKVKSLKYRIAGTEEKEAVSGTVTDDAVTVPINPNQQVVISATVEMSEFDRSQTQQIGMQMVSDPCSESPRLIEQSIVLLPPLDFSLVDPLGQVTGCAGEILPDYRGFSVAMYDADPNDPLANITSLTELTVTEVPDNPNNNIPKGLAPNTENSNPFFLTNQDVGRYSFLFDDSRGQLDFGRTYVLIVTPPEGIDYNQRRIKIEIGDRTENVVQYTATSLDGQPISSTDDRTTFSDVIRIDDANTVGLILAVLNVDSSVCESEAIEIVKSGDRASATPGDIVLYRLTVRSLASSSINQVTVTDILPVGFRLRPEAVRGQVDGKEVEISTQQDQREISFSIDRSLDQGDVLNIVYAAEVTPDALRGEGVNSAVVTAERLDNGDRISDGPAVHEVDIDPGIITDCGTLIGRVFEDHNFDGQQQSGEPGIPNAVIFLENGNRVTTDADGLFTVNCMLPGYHTGQLDLTSVPGYQLAPNLKFSEGNSHSRIVRLSPGGMARMNFAVTPSGDQIETEGEDDE